MSQLSTTWRALDRSRPLTVGDTTSLPSLWRICERASGAFFAATILFAVAAFPIYKGQWLGFAPVLGGALCFALTRYTTITCRVIEVIKGMTARRFSLLVWMLALGTRALAMLLFADSPVSDHASYHESAMRMLNGEGYPPSAYYPPGMAFWLYAIYSVSGGSIVAALAVNIVVGGLMSWMTYVAGRHIVGESAARLAAIASALFPSLVLYATTLGYDPLLGCVLLMAVWLLVRKPVTEHRLTHVAMIGAMIGFASFLKPIGLLLPVLFAFAYLRRGAGVLKSARNGGIMMAAMLITLSPWSLRNAVLFGKYVPVTTSGGVGLWIANHEGATGLTCPLPYFPPGTNEVERDTLLWQEAWTYVSKHPVESLALLPKKAAFLWGTSSTVMATVSADRWPPALEAAAKAGINLAWTFIVLWFAAGVMSKRRLFADARYLWPAGMMLIYLFCIHQFYEAQSRYHLPFIPFLFMGAAAAICHCHRKDGQPATV